MKKIYWAICYLFVMTACGTASSIEVNYDDSSHGCLQHKSLLKQGSLVRDRIVNKSISKYELKGERGDIYEVFLVSEKENQEYLALMKKNDPEILLYQDLIDLKGGQFIPITEYSFLVISNIDSETKTAHYIYIKDGKLALAPIKDSTKNYFLIHGSDVKIINETIFQTIYIATDQSKWGFQTWQLKVENAELQLIEDTQYSTSDSPLRSQMGRYYLRKWKENEDFFFNYQDDPFSISMIDPFVQTLGIRKQELIDIVGSPSLVESISGGEFYIYNDHAYIIDTLSQEIQAVVIPGSRINMKINSVTTLLGQPDDINLNEQYGSYFYTYQSGDYSLSFETSVTDETILNVWIE